MKLPRYSSTALPRTVNISPQMAGQAAATRGQLVNQAVGEFSAFAVQMMKAESESKAREDMADASIKLSEFENDNRWEQDEIDGRPTETVMMEEFALLEKEMIGAGEDIQLRSVREQVKTQTEQALVETRLKAESVGNHVRIRRTKARDSMSMDKQQRAGNFDAAAGIVTEGYESGMYTMGERDALLEQNEKIKRLTPYIDVIGSGDIGRLNSKALEALDDKTLRADEKIDMWRTLSNAADSEEAKFYADRTRRWNENSVEVWKNFDKLSPEDIVAKDISPDLKRSALMMKRNQREAGGKTPDDPGIVNAIYEQIAAMSEGDEPYSNVIETIGRYAGKGLSWETAVKAQQDAITYSDKIFAGADFNGILQAGYNEITKGVPIDSMTDIWDTKAPELMKLAQEWRTALVEAKIKEGPAFDARKFYTERFDKDFRTKALAIQEPKEKHKVEVGTYISMPEFQLQGGGLDNAGIISKMQADGADEESVKNAQIILRDKSQTILNSVFSR